MGGKPPGTGDRRVRRTRRALQDALLALILERGWDGFSVQDLCERADVGRSTFYTHFADKEEVVTSGLEELGRDLRAQLAGSGAARPLGFSRGLIEHAHGHLRVFRALVGRRSGHLVQGKMRELVHQLVQEDLAGLLPPGARRDGAAAFLAGAFFELLFWSLQARHAPTVEEADALFQEFALPVLAAARLPAGSARDRAGGR